MQVVLHRLVTDFPRVLLVFTNRLAGDSSWSLRTYTIALPGILFLRERFPQLHKIITRTQLHSLTIAAASILSDATPGRPDPQHTLNPVVTVLAGLPRLSFFCFKKYSRAGKRVPISRASENEDCLPVIEGGLEPARRIADPTLDEKVNVHGGSVGRRRIDC